MENAPALRTPTVVKVNEGPLTEDPIKSVVCVRNYVRRVALTS